MEDLIGVYGILDRDHWPEAPFQLLDGGVEIRWKEPYAFHNPFFQPRDIRLGNPEKIRNFLLRFLPSLRHIDAEPELHNHLLPL